MDTQKTMSFGDLTRRSNVIEADSFLLEIKIDPIYEGARFKGKGREGHERYLRKK